MSAHRVRAKSSLGGWIPKGFEFDVINDHGSGVDERSIKEALRRCGFNEDACRYASPCNFEIIY